MSRLHRHVMRVLLGDIVSGHLAPGAALPRETDLAQQFRVSRGVARECVRGLEERGLITVKHGRGATVLAEQEWDVFDSEVLGAIFENQRGGALLAEYLECRRLLEIEAAGLAAERAGEDDLARLSDALARMCMAAERASQNAAAAVLYDRADADFHHALIAATGNRPLGRMAAPIQRALASDRGPVARPGRRLAQGVDAHRRILAAVAAGDVTEARTAMRDHLDSVVSPVPEERTA